MVRLERPANLIRAATQHAERVYAVAQGAAPAPDIEELASSWQRSTNRVDPVDSRAPRILTAGELKDFARAARHAHLDRPGGARPLIQSGS